MQQLAALGGPVEVMLRAAANAATSSLDGTPDCESEFLVTGPFGFCCSGCSQMSSVHSRKCRRRHESLVARRAQESASRNRALLARAASVDPTPFLDQMD